MEYTHRSYVLNFFTSGVFGKTRGPNLNCSQLLSALYSYVPGIRGGLGGPFLNTHQDYYPSYTYRWPGYGLQPHPRIRELAEKVRTLSFHYMENETESKSPPTFLNRRQINTHRS